MFFVLFYKKNIQRPFGPVLKESAKSSAEQ